MEPTSIDWAQLAAYIDGEGAIIILRRAGLMGYKNPYYQLRLVVSNTDRRLIDWIVATFGGHISTRKNGYGFHPYWEWRTQSGNAEAILRGCLPYFHIKREQADIALQFRDTFNKRGLNAGIPPEIVALRDSLGEGLKLCRKRFLAERTTLQDAEQMKRANHITNLNALKRRHNTRVESGQL